MVKREYVSKIIGTGQGHDDAYRPAVDDVLGCQGSWSWVEVPPHEDGHPTVGEGRVVVHAPAELHDMLAAHPHIEPVKA